MCEEMLRFVAKTNNITDNIKIEVVIIKITEQVVNAFFFF